MGLPGACQRLGLRHVLMEQLCSVCSRACPPPPPPFLSEGKVALSTGRGGGQLVAVLGIFFSLFFESSAEVTTKQGSEETVVATSVSQGGDEWECLGIHHASSFQAFSPLMPAFGSVCTRGVWMCVERIFCVNMCTTTVCVCVCL